MKAETKALLEAVKKKVKSTTTLQFDDAFLIKYFGKPAQKMYRDISKSIVANTLLDQKQKKKGKKHYSKKVR